MKEKLAFNLNPGSSELAPLRHGIPDSTEVLDGDIINVDVTVYLNGYHGDTSRTIMVGRCKLTLY